MCYFNIGQLLQLDIAERNNRSIGLWGESTWEILLSISVFLNMKARVEIGLLH